MPRPKPPEKLFERCIRLTDTQWAELHRRGGPQWLRTRLGSARSVAQWRTDRNQTIKKERRRGATVSSLAVQHSIHPAQIYKILKAA